MYIGNMVLLWLCFLHCHVFWSTVCFTWWWPHNCRSWEHNFGSTLLTRYGDDWVIEVVESHYAGTWEITLDPHFLWMEGCLWMLGICSSPCVFFELMLSQQVKWSCIWKLHYVQDVGVLNNRCLKQLAEGQYVLISLFVYCIVVVNPSLPALSTQWMGHASLLQQLIYWRCRSSQKLLLLHVLYCVTGHCRLFHSLWCVQGSSSISFSDHRPDNALWSCSVWEQYSL
jgi:hypothetical protein